MRYCLQPPDAFKDFGAMKASEKNTIRRRIRAGFPGDMQRQLESEAICRHLMAWKQYDTASCIGFYMPMKREADITPVIIDALAHGKMVALPRVEDKGMMSFRSLTALEQLNKGSYGILEPNNTAPIVTADAIEVLVVPIEAIRHDGLRLGKGGGFYDRLLAQRHGLTIGAVLSWQWADDIPQEAWDQTLDAAVDHNGIHLFGTSMDKE